MKILEKYARLVIEVGVNLTEGQEVVIMAPVEAHDFVRLLARHAYERGAKRVIDGYTDDQLQRLYLERAEISVLEEFVAWKINGVVGHLENGACIINIMMPDPELMEGVPAERLAIHQRTQSKGLRDFYRQTMSGDTKWVIAALPSVPWAKKMFPEMDPEEAMEALWETLVSVNRLDSEDPVSVWKQHLEGIDKKRGVLNGLGLKKLVFDAPGTSLEMELPDGHVWLGGAHETNHSESFLPNIPTEEVFSMPHKYRVNGTVSSTMPLIHSGNLVEGFSFTFVDGQVKSYDAQKGKEILDNLFSVDEGARRLGEVALVPQSSPIARTGRVFYNTLFDENASCHLALGAAYGACHQQGNELDENGKDRVGINDSLVHVDFMIGSDAMKITGTDSQGTEILLFENGEWTI